MAICVDCDQTVDIDSHGKCKKCGSSSIIIPNSLGIKQLEANEVTPHKIIEEANRVIHKFSGEEITEVNRMALLMVSARNARICGERFGFFLEKVIKMWALAVDVEEGKLTKREPDKPGN